VGIGPTEERYREYIRPGPVARTLLRLISSVMEWVSSPYAIPSYRNGIGQYVIDELLVVVRGQIIEGINKVMARPISCLFSCSF